MAPRLAARTSATPQLADFYSATVAWFCSAVDIYVRINGEMRYLWRAVDHEGEVLESFVTKERDKAAALKFIKKTMKRHGSPKAITTDGLRSYKATLKELGSYAGNWVTG